MRKPPSTTPLGNSAANQVLQQWIVAANDLASLASHYIASSHREPKEYCSRAQLSVTDWPPPHGLESTTGDRRVWNVEVQHHRDLPATPAAGLERIVVDSRSLVRAVEGDFPDLIGRVQFVDLADYPDEEAEGAYVRELSEVRLA